MQTRVQNANANTASPNGSQLVHKTILRIKKEAMFLYSYINTIPNQPAIGEKYDKLPITFIINLSTLPTWFIFIIVS